MNRLIATTAALAVALNGTVPAFAQTLELDADGRVIGADGAVLCDPAAGAACDPEEIAARLAAEAEAAAAKAAEDAARAEAEAAAARAAEDAARAEAEAAAARAAEDAARAEAEAAAAKAAEDAARAEAEAAAAKAAEDAARAEAEAAAARAAEDAARAEAEAAAARAAKDAARAEAEAAAARAADDTAQTAAEPVATDDPAPETRPEPRPETLVAAPESEAVIPPAPEPEAVETLESILAPATDPAEGAEAPPAAAAAAAEGEETAPVATTTATITEADTRASNQEFAAAPQADARGRRGLSDLEKVGLVALGALAVGAVLKNGDRVVSNSGDRVVVDRGDGRFDVLKDDDTLLRRPGATVETETFRDGSTRSTVTRADGSRVVTIRDAAGRVLRRARIDVDGRETLLLDDLAPVAPIDVTALPPPAPPVSISTAGDPALAAALAAISAREAARGFSLRQIREVREVRRLAPPIDVTPITFRTGSSAIDVTEAEKLAALGRFIADTVRERPYEMFLIEGHTDAVGSAASNLALSDRRAESVALALTEYFGVPPENLVVQGYGESDLLIPTEAAEPLNRRVGVRMISPLLEARLR